MCCFKQNFFFLVPKEKRGKNRRKDNTLNQRTRRDEASKTPVQWRHFSHPIAPFSAWQTVAGVSFLSYKGGGKKRLLMTGFCFNALKVRRYGVASSLFFFHDNSSHEVGLLKLIFSSFGKLSVSLGLEVRIELNHLIRSNQIVDPSNQINSLGVSGCFLLENANYHSWRQYRRG